MERSADVHPAMAQGEAGREDGIHFVMITNPNHMHFPAAKAFLEQGIHVVSDKPMTFSLDEAQELAKIVERSNLVYALTHNYTGYPAVRQARYMVRQGELGDIRKVLVEYIQDWLMTPEEKAGNKHAAWRNDPTKSCIAGCVGDIGTHAENLLEFITGVKIVSLCADLSTFVEGRLLDDDANMLLRLDNGGKGVLTCSQGAAGEENALSIRLYCSKAGVEWHPIEAKTMIFQRPKQPGPNLRARPFSLKDE